MSPLAMLAESEVSGRPIRRVGMIVAAVGLAWTLLVGVTFLLVYAVYAILHVWFITIASVAITAAIFIGAAAAVIYGLTRRPHGPVGEIGHDFVEHHLVQILVAAFAVGFGLASSATLRDFAMKHASKLIVDHLT